MPGRYRIVEADTPALRRLPWEKMEEEGLAQAVLWNRCEPTILDWLELVSPRTTLTGLGYDEGRDGALMGALWLLPMGVSATVHFVVFRAWWQEQIPIGRAAVRWIFARWPFKSLLATYPAPYHHLHRFMDGLGFSRWPYTVPGACHMPTRKHPDRCADLAFASLTREEFMKEQTKWAES